MLLVDAHVHIYQPFDLDRFFYSAYRNFSRFSPPYQGENIPQAMVIIADWRNQCWFQKLADLSDGHQIEDPRLPRQWKFTRTREPLSLIARNSHRDTLFVAAGRKIVTSENLEVIAPFTSQPLADDQSLSATIDAIMDTDTLAIVPWAAGKWLGARGRILSAYLAKAPKHDVFLCDSGNRPTFWPSPNHFDLASRYGIRILAGSDPLHFADEVDRTGSFGFCLPAAISDQTPASDLKALLRDDTLPIGHFGSLETPSRFVRNQFAMQVFRKKHQRHLGYEQRRKQR